MHVDFGERLSSQCQRTSEKETSRSTSGHLSALRCTLELLNRHQTCGGLRAAPGERPRPGTTAIAASGGGDSSCLIVSRLLRTAMCRHWRCLPRPHIRWTSRQEARVGSWSQPVFLHVFASSCVLLHSCQGLCCLLSLTSNDGKQPSQFSCQFLVGTGGFRGTGSPCENS